MAKAELGEKRSCLSCGIRFYDLRRSPIICPGCGKEFDLKLRLKAAKDGTLQKAADKSVAGAVDVGDDVDLIDDDLEDDDVEMIASSTADDSDDNIDFDDDLEVGDDDGSSIIRDDLDDGLLTNMHEKG